MLNINKNIKLQILKLELFVIKVLIIKNKFCKNKVNFLLIMYELFRFLDNNFKLFST